MTNPRYANGHRRRELRKRLASLGQPCHICGGAIDYSLPAGHPQSFEVDEIVPVSKFWSSDILTGNQTSMSAAPVPTGFGAVTF